MILHEYFSYSSVPLKQVYNSHINWDPKKLEEKDICTWAKESLVMWCGIRDRYISERLTHLVFCVFIQRWNVCLWFLIPFISAFCLVDTSLTLLSCSLRLEFSPVHRSMWVFPTWVRLLPVHMARPVALQCYWKPPCFVYSAACLRYLFQCRLKYFVSVIVRKLPHRWGLHHCQPWDPLRPRLHFALTHSLHSIPAGAWVPGLLLVFLTLPCVVPGLECWQPVPIFACGNETHLKKNFFLIVWNSVLKTQIQAVSHKTYFLWLITIVQIPLVISLNCYMYIVIQLSF